MTFQRLKYESAPWYKDRPLESMGNLQLSQETIFLCVHLAGYKTLAFEIYEKQILLNKTLP